MSPLERLERLLTAARQAGAEEADAVLTVRSALTVSVRLGRLEHVERSESTELGLRVFLGGRSAVVAAENPDAVDAAELAERAVAMARVLPADPHAGLSPFRPALITAAALDLADPFLPDRKSVV